MAVCWNGVRSPVLDAGERRKIAERFAAAETIAELARNYVTWESPPSTAPFMAGDPLWRPSGPGQDQYPFTGVKLGGASFLGDFKMQKHVLVVATSAFILAYGVVAATAQQQGPMTATPSQQTGQQQGGMGQGGMMGCDMMGQGGMMRGGMMGGHPVMMRMILP